VHRASAVEHCIFITRQFEKAGAELGTAETKCANDDELMEELHYLHGRTNGEMAKEKQVLAIRRAYESLAWKNYDESWRYRRQQKDFAAVNVLQMCFLSTRRADVTVAELRVPRRACGTFSHVSSPTNLPLPINPLLPTNRMVLANVPDATSHGQDCHALGGTG
jgi:hypothetical protein